MQTPTTDEDWETLISTVKSSLPAVQQQQRPLYPSPADPSSLAATIDHTLLAPSATTDQIDTLCAEAHEHAFATVCVRLAHVQRAAANLADTPAVGVACVVGFHQGTQSTQEKVHEAREAVKHGASELDMVMNYPLLKAGRLADVADDIRAVRRAAAAADDGDGDGDGGKGNVGLKVIIETSQLTRDETIGATVVVCLSGADFVKTSTGFNGPGASVENVALMRAIGDAVEKGVKIKASGGVRTTDDCVRMIQAGADRIGASAGVKIVQGLSGGDGDQDKGNLGTGAY